MKCMLSCLFLLMTYYADCQPLAHYRDTINNFEIGIPSGWRYFPAKNKMDFPLKVLRPAEPGETAVINFNVNIINQPGINTEISYKKLLSALKSTNNFKLIEEGDIVTSTETFKWLKETHKNDFSASQDLANYTFLTWKNGKTYILTFVSPSQDLEKYEALFLHTAKSFSVLTGTKEELK